MAVANDIARYFHRKILNIRNELDGIDVTENRCSDLIDDLLLGFGRLCSKKKHILLLAVLIFFRNIGIPMFTLTLSSYFGSPGES